MAELEEEVHLGLRRLPRLASLRLRRAGLPGRLVAGQEPRADGDDGRVELRLNRPGPHHRAGHGLHLVRVVQRRAVELRPQVQHRVGVGRVGQFRRVVVLAEGGLDVLGLVGEVHDVGRVLAGVGAVEPRQGLHGLDAAQLAVHVHRAEQGLVEPGLKLVGDEEDGILLRPERGPDVAPLEAGVHVGLVEGLRPRLRVLHVAGEGDEQADGPLPPLDIGLHGLHPPHGLLAARRDHHRLGLPAEQVGDVLPEVVHHDLHAGRDVVGVQAHPAHDALLGLEGQGVLLMGLGHQRCEAALLLDGAVALQQGGLPLVLRLADTLPQPSEASCQAALILHASERQEIGPEAFAGPECALLDDDGSVSLRCGDTECASNERRRRPRDRLALRIQAGRATTRRRNRTLGQRGRGFPDAQLVGCDAGLLHWIGSRRLPGAREHHGAGHANRRPGWLSPSQLGTHRRPMGLLEGGAGLPSQRGFGPAGTLDVLLAPGGEGGTKGNARPVHWVGRGEVDHQNFFAARGHVRDKVRDQQRVQVHVALVPVTHHAPEPVAKFSLKEGDLQLLPRSDLRGPAIWPGLEDRARHRVTHDDGGDDASLALDPAANAVVGLCLARFRLRQHLGRSRPEHHHRRPRILDVRGGARVALELGDHLLRREFGPVRRGSRSAPLLRRRLGSEVLDREKSGAQSHRGDHRLSAPASSPRFRSMISASSGKRRPIHARTSFPLSFTSPNRPWLLSRS